MQGKCLKVKIILEQNVMGETPSVSEDGGMMKMTFNSPYFSDSEMNWSRVDKNKLHWESVHLFLTGGRFPFGYFLSWSAFSFSG